MPYRVPNMNLNVFLWRAPNTVVSAPDHVFVGNLSRGQHVMTTTGEPYGILNGGLQMLLAVPKGSDIRGLDGLSLLDLVEVPALSGRYYFVTGVDDIGKGFANEYRAATLVKINAYIFGFFPNPWNCPMSWPVPYP